MRTGPISAPGTTAAIQCKIDPGKEQYVGRRVKETAGNGTILEVVGDQGYTVAFDDGRCSTRPAR